MVRLCQECKHLLYPKNGNSYNRELFFYCKNCRVKTPSRNTIEENLIYENDLSTSKGQMDVAPLFHKDLTLDPALPRRRDIPCPKCEGKDIKYFCPFKETMAIYFVCCNTECNHYWKQVNNKKSKEGKTSKGAEQEEADEVDQEDAEELDENEVFGYNDGDDDDEDGEGEDGNLESG
eukprot:jgi/Bigna1/87355/estExt_fgenesh1_pg.C_190144